MSIGAIWRRVDVRSDLRLDAVHQVLQVGFSWDDYRLWRFSLGGEPFGRDGQLFLRPWDVEEGELENEPGVPGAEARIDEGQARPWRSAGLPVRLRRQLGAHATTRTADAPLELRDQIEELWCLPAPTPLARIQRLQDSQLGQLLEPAASADQ